MQPIVRLTGILVMATLAVTALSCGPSEQSIQATVDAKIAQSIAAIPTPTPQSTATPQATATPQPLPTPQPTATPQPQPTPQPTVTPQPSPTLVPTATPQPLPTRVPTATPQPTATPIKLPPTPTPQPTATPMALASPPTPQPTATPMLLPPTPTAAPSAARVYAGAHASVAMIGTTLADGSGFYIGDRWIVTAAHVVLNSNGTPTQTTGIQVYLDGRRITTTGTLVGWNRQKDVAVLRVPAEPGVPALQFGRTALNGVGDRVYIVGFPLALTVEPMITEGVISQFYSDTAEPPPMGRVLLYDVVGPSGSSGSPVLDAAGRVVAVHQAGYVADASSEAPLGINKGIISDEVLDILSSIEAGSQG